jgi:hypothetical protein
MSNVLWIIGAGASCHLGMPLLGQFPSFFAELWDRFEENRRDAEFINTLPQARQLMQLYPDQNIEALLSVESALSPENKDVIRRAIRRRCVMVQPDLEESPR